MPIHEQHLEIISEIIITLNKFDLEEKVCDYENWFNKWSINWTWQLGRLCHHGLDDYESDLGTTENSSFGSEISFKWQKLLSPVSALVRQGWNKSFA